MTHAHCNSELIKKTN